jgi:hypothetical protein
MDLSKILKEKRPNVTDSTIKTYKSLLTNLYKSCFSKDDEMTVKHFDDDKVILPYLIELPVNTRKTKLAALIVLTGNKEYSKQMTSDIQELISHNLKQEKNEKQTDNMISPDEVQTIYNRVESNAKVHLQKKEFNNNDFDAIQNWILLALTSGIFIAPRRSADWNMKWKNYDVDKDNYVDVKNSQFVFNSYKTAKLYGKSMVDIPKPLKLILNKWFKINPTDYIIFDNKKQPLNSPQITHKLNNIFGKKISTSMLRHIYLTHKFGNINLQDLNDTAAAMGTSKMEALQYVKH